MKSEIEAALSCWDILRYSDWTMLSSVRSVYDVLPLRLPAVCWHGKWLRNQETPRSTTWIHAVITVISISVLSHTNHFAWFNMRNWLLPLWIQNQAHVLANYLYAARSTIPLHRRHIKHPTLHYWSFVTVRQCWPVDSPHQRPAINEVFLCHGKAPIGGKCNVNFSLIRDSKVCLFARFHSAGKLFRWDPRTPAFMIKTTESHFQLTITSL